MVCGQRLVSLHAALEIGGGLGDGMLPLRCRGLALVACVVLGLADDVGGVEEGAGLVEGAGSVVLVDGAAEEGGGGGVALAKGAVERRIVTSRDCGVGAGIEEELDDGGVAMLSEANCHQQGLWGRRQHRGGAERRRSGHAQQRKRGQSCERCSLR